jgi:hypothetical protein
MKWVANPVTWSKMAANGFISETMYDIEVVVEDTVNIVSGGSDYVMPDGDIALLSRPKGIEAPAGSGPSLATIECFLRYDMEVEAKRDQRHLVNQFCVEVVTPASGVYLKAV